MSKKVGVVLSGCGFLDGAEIHEATLTLLALDRAGGQTVAMATRVPPLHNTGRAQTALNYTKSIQCLSCIDFV